MSTPSIFPGGPVPKNTDPVEFSMIKLLEIFLNAIDGNGALKVTGAGLYFKDLADTPRSYEGQAGRLVTVRQDETGLEFTIPEEIVWGAITGNIADQTDLITLLSGYVLASSLGAANGVATLGPDSQLTGSQIPAALLGATKFMGVWDADANTTNPNLGPLVSATPPDQGQYWIVTTPGATSLSGITDWKLGDWVISLGASGWAKVDNTDAVVSVAGKIGLVTLDLSDLTNVLITTPVDGQVLTYDALSGKWVNSTSSGGGGADLQEVWMNTGL